VHAVYLSGILFLKIGAIPVDDVDELPRDFLRIFYGARTEAGPLDQLGEHQEGLDTFQRAFIACMDAQLFSQLVRVSDIKPGESG
jgi:hypothetical protein